MASDSWTRRWIWSAIIQGAIFAIATFILFIYGSVYLSATPAMVMVGTEAGLWLSTGYLLYLALIGAFGITAFFYHYIIGGRARMTRISGILAWAQLILMNIGVFGASVLLMYAGYVGGAALLPTSSGGGGLTALQVHVQILQYYPEPIAIFAGIALLGALCGGIVLINGLRSGRR